MVSLVVSIVGLLVALGFYFLVKWGNEGKHLDEEEK